jgi:hypothetical protein
VFLFAGPHNVLEARYFLGQMPARWGPMAPYFAVGLAGVVGLAAWQIGLAVLTRAGFVSPGGGEAGLTARNAALIGWVVLLMLMRSRQNPRRPGFAFALPVGCGLLALNLWQPLAFSFALVYLHPLVALWFLDRELQRRRPGWRRGYRLALACVPLVIGLLWLRLSAAPDLPGEDLLSMQIAWHAGGGFFEDVSTHFLVATHTFLEMLHYAVWLVAVPLVALTAAPWRIDQTPLGRRSRFWRRAIATLLLAGCAIVAALWCGFLIDYPLTRDLYFTLALGHVLAEIPFLLRLL